MGKRIVAIHGLEDEGVRTWQDLGFSRTYDLWKNRVVRQPDGSYEVDSLSRPGVKHFVSYDLGNCSCEHRIYSDVEADGEKPVCIHMRLAERRDAEHRREDARRTDERRAEIKKTERFRRSPAEIEAALSAWGGIPE